MVKRLRAHMPSWTGKEAIRARLLRYTRKAFRMLPRLDKPRILDIGCGSGVPTIELARLSGGEVIGIDTDQTALDRFSSRIIEADLADRVKAIPCSLWRMDWADEQFDIIWAEGSISGIGFERGLRKWKRFLKPGGFMVIHDEQGNIEEKIVQISGGGYELLGFFTLNEEVWRKRYFVPLEEWIAGSQTMLARGEKVMGDMRQARTELEMFKKHPDRNRSVFFVMKKK
jgi:SAM-dependent methyltransferase